MGDFEVKVASIEEIRPLLQRCGLSADDLVPDRAEVLAARRCEAVEGCIALEFFGSQVLIRSLAVDDARRGTGIGRVLVQSALRRAISSGASEAFAVTTGAPGYLARFGFEAIDRAGLVGDILESSQLQGACPGDAIVLRRGLRPVVLFMCVHNAGRSQMAGAMLLRRAGDRIEVRSAGSEPAAEVNAAVIDAMRELGVDLSNEVPKKMTLEMAREADVVVTMGCGDACPVFPGKRYVDWDLADPAGLPVEAIRPIRDEISRRVDGLIEELRSWSPDM